MGTASAKTPTVVPVPSAEEKTPSSAAKPLPKVYSYGLVDARPAGGTLSLVRLTTRGKEVADVQVCGIYDDIISAIDAYYNHAHARWYVREPMPEGPEDVP